LDKRADIYNDLVKWEQRKQLYPIHKRLLPFIYNGHTCKDVNDLLELQSFNEAEQILDIGCGVGNTLIQLALKRKIEGLGISISSDEVRQANQNAKQNNLEAQVKFVNQNFDNHIHFQFDKAIAIESLKHSFDIDITAKNIFNAAKQGSAVFVIDDFLMGTEQQNYYTRTLKKDWNLSRLYTRKDFESAFIRAGFSGKESIDLTPYVLPKSKLLLKCRIFIFSLIEKLTFKKSRKNLLAIFKSGFILELLFQQKLFTYECLVFFRPAETNNDLRQKRTT
jgi:SAM-dependent methyltransferase